MRRIALAATAAVLTTLSPALAQDFPLEITHKFGTTTIPEAPERVATVDGNGADNLLALGFQPVTIEDWYGGYDQGLWPWASPLLITDPVMLARGTLDFERILTTEPDLILSLYNSMTPAEYDKLSEIAPVVAVPEGRGDWSLTWKERAYFTGLATGRLAEAEARIAGIDARMEEIATAHPEWQGKTALVAWINNDGQLGVARIGSTTTLGARTQTSDGTATRERAAPRARALRSCSPSRPRATDDAPSASRSRAAARREPPNSCHGHPVCG